MGMTPEHFLEGFVEWNLLDCREQPGDVRRAFNAAVSLSHLADQYFTYYSVHQPKLVAQFKTLGEFVGHVSTATAGNFTDVRSVSNAYKHLYTGSGPLAKYSSVSSPGAIECIELQDTEAIGSISEEFENTSDSDTKLCVVVKRNDGSRFELLPSMELVAKYFRTLIYNGA